MGKKLLMVSLAACCAIVLSASVAVAADNWLGTWKLDLTKSKFNPGPAPKSMTLKFESTKDGTKLTTDTVDASGKAVTGTYTSKFDGKDVAWVGNPNADTASPKKLDDNTYTNTWKLAGKETVSAKVVVAPDGKSLTITQSGKDAKGQVLDVVEVMVKQ
jgi:hypothetical protein